MTTVGLGIFALVSGTQLLAFFTMPWEGFLAYHIGSSVGGFALMWREFKENELYLEKRTTLEYIHRLFSSEGIGDGETMLRFIKKFRGDEKVLMDELDNIIEFTNEGGFTRRYKSPK